MKATKMLRRLLTVAVSAVILLAACAPALAASFKAEINSASARVYKVPSKSSKISVSAPKGVKVTVTGYANGWARIKYGDNVGYMPVKYLNLTQRLKAYTTKSTSVYEKDSASSSRLGKLPRATAVYVVGYSSGYCRIQNRSGSITGYVDMDNLASESEMRRAYKAYKEYLEAKEEANGSGNSSSSGGSGNSGNTSGGSGNTGDGGSSETQPSTSSIDRVISLAKTLIGRPYAASANPPSSFNCSEFVEYCMEKYGYSMNGTAASQASDDRYAKITGVSNLKKGDVLCFDTDEDGVCDHTAIYLGSGSFIEASQNAGKVQTNTLSSWYEDHLLFARRPE